MHILEDGIMEPSRIYFLLPSDFALHTLYSLQHIGIFYCNSSYEATHPYWESVLLIFVDEGRLEVSFDDQLFVADKDDIVMIDCRKHHSYRALENLKFRFFHFTGICSASYTELVYQLYSGPIIRNYSNAVINTAFQNLLRLAQAQANIQNEHRISVYLHIILCELVENSSGSAAGVSDSITAAIRYMEDHVTQNISLDKLADIANLNKFYFARCFKNNVGMTPHQYFLNMKIQYAKRLLITTAASVEEIAEQCGFDNTSNFIRLFKQRAGMTPTAFRKIPF